MRFHVLKEEQVSHSYDELHETGEGNTHILTQLLTVLGSKWQHGEL
jgi:hypothetical protein